VRLAYTGYTRELLSVPTEEITELLNQWGRGDADAGERVFRLIYDELRQIAGRWIRQGEPHTLQITALVHEAYLRLTGDSGKQWETRGHFFGVAAKAMRHILVDHARAGVAAKRGGSLKPLPLNDALDLAPDRSPELVLLDDALNALAKLHPRQSQVIELRFFGGLSVEQTAETLQVSAETIARDWRAAKAWLYRELQKREASG